MKKIRKIFCFFILLIMIINFNVYAMYHYDYRINAFSLTRDISKITYSLQKSDNEYTNKDVTLEITTNKKIYPIEGYLLSDDGKKLTKNFTKNDTETIVLKDNSGNKEEVICEINNIDKVLPQINGINDGTTYSTNLKPTYTDNFGIKDIIINKYGTSLAFSCYTSYYDTSKYKGIDVTKNSIYIWITDKPKGTVKYKYYINNILKKETTEEEYTFTGLQTFTSYNVKVEAIDINDNVISSINKTIKTRYFERAEATKIGEKFTIKLYGIDSAVKQIVTTKFSASNRNNIKYGSININSDRSATASLVATDITSSVETGYYYLQLFMKGDSDTTLDTVNCNIIFNTNYVKPTNNIDPYSITQNGFYEITVTDLAGNITKKCFTLKK